MIISRCISICKTDPATGYCYRCGRSNDIQLQEIEKRLNGWQLESFKESYKSKVENGISLYKKENMK